MDAQSGKTIDSSFLMPRVDRARMNPISGFQSMIGKHHSQDCGKQFYDLRPCKKETLIT